MKIDKNYRKLLKLLYNNRKKNKGRPDTCDIEHYLDVIIFVLESGIRWKDIRDRLHYSTYHKKFMRMVELRIFEKAFNLYVKYLKKHRKMGKYLFVDSTSIRNQHGKDFVGRNKFDKCKKGSKINIIVTKHGYPVAIHVSPANVHDIKNVRPLLDSIIEFSKGSKLIGDKGYIGKLESDHIKANYEVEMITPTKKNMKESLVDHRKILKKRSIVENFFSWMKNNRHIRLRHDRNIESFYGFCHLACIKTISNKLLT